MSKNPQHDCVKPRGGGGGGARAVCTMCKKTSDLVADGFPNAWFDTILKLGRRKNEGENCDKSNFAVPCGVKRKVESNLHGAVVSICNCSISKGLR